MANDKSGRHVIHPARVEHGVRRPPDDHPPQVVSGRRATPLEVAGAVLVSSTIAIVPLDFATLGLTNSGGVDVAKWAAHLPFLAASVYLFAAVPDLGILLRRGATALIGLWLTWCWVGVATSIDRRQTIIAALLMTAIWLGVTWQVARFGLVRFAQATIIALSIVIAGGLVNDLVGAPADSPEGRMVGWTLGANDLAIASGAVLIWSLIVHRTTGNRWWLLAAPLAGATLIGSGGRMPTIATLAVALAVFGRSWRSRFLLTATALVLLPVILASPLAASFQRTERVVAQAPSAGVIPAEQLNGRLELWTHAAGLIAERPMNGYGLKAGNTLWRAAYLGSDFEINAGHSHNMLVEVVLATGVIGAVLILGALGRTLVGLWQGEMRVAIAVLLLLVTLGLTEAVVEGPTTGFIQLTALAAAASAHHGRARSGERGLQPDRPNYNRTSNA